MHANWLRLRFFAAFAAASLASAVPAQTPPDLVLGTWVLNVEKSTYSPGPPPKAQTRVYEAHGDGVKATITTIGADGNEVKAEYTANYDSLEYPLTGSAQVDAIALKRVSVYRAEATLMHARKVIGSAVRIISEDGKSMTIRFKGIDRDGRSVDNNAVYDKK
jgi:hypothetical protein